MVIYVVFLKKMSIFTNSQLYIFCIKKKLWKILLGIQKFGQKWSTIACKYLNVVKCCTRAQCYTKEYNVAKQKHNMMFKIFKMIKVGYGKGTKRQTTIDSLHAII
jgi:hypothetical protein